MLFSFRSWLRSSLSHDGLCFSEKLGSNNSHHVMSVRQLIPSLGKELDYLYARISYLEGMLGVGVPSEADRSCKPCGITWQLGLTCFPQHMAGRRHNKMLMAKQSKNSSQPGFQRAGTIKAPSPISAHASTSRQEAKRASREAGKQKLIQRPREE